jgi:hypothetical protein
MPGMLGVIVAVVAGVLFALLAIWLSAPTSITIVAAAAGFVASVVVIGLFTRHALVTFVSREPGQFPSLRRGCRDEGMLVESGPRPWFNAQCAASTGRPTIGTVPLRSGLAVARPPVQPCLQRTQAFTCA